MCTSSIFFLCCIYGIEVPVLIIYDIYILSQFSSVIYLLAVGFLSWYVYLS